MESRFEFTCCSKGNHVNVGDLLFHRHNHWIMWHVYCCGVEKSNFRVEDIVLLWYIKGRWESNTHTRGCVCSHVMFTSATVLPRLYKHAETSVKVCYCLHAYCALIDWWSSCRRVHSTVRPGRRSKTFSLSVRSSFANRRWYWSSKSETGSGTATACLCFPVVVMSPTGMYNTVPFTSSDRDTERVVVTWFQGATTRVMKRTVPWHRVFFTDFFYWYHTNKKKVLPEKKKRLWIKNVWCLFEKVVVFLKNNMLYKCELEI